MKALYTKILAAASTDATVVIRGASGTGKSLVAQAIHANSRRCKGPLVHIDCTSLPAGLIENELFGHERGAFTGAEKRVHGKFELANAGTIFLDEIGDLPMALQGKLLRFLQNRSFERLGGQTTIVSDVRVISATNADLESLLKDRRFRQDLYYRLKVVELQVPGLAIRGPLDIQLLAEHFLCLYARRHKRPAQILSEHALTKLQFYAWPGNVRELEHCIESAVVLCAEEIIDASHLALPDADTDANPNVFGGYSPTTPLAQVEIDHIHKAVEYCDGNRTRAAQLLGIGRNTLCRKIKK
jgi:Nif-specific regulatory protein